MVHDCLVVHVKATHNTTLNAISHPRGSDNSLVPVIICKKRKLWEEMLEGNNKITINLPARTIVLRSRRMWSSCNTWPQMLWYLHVAPNAGELVPTIMTRAPMGWFAMLLLIVVFCVFRVFCVCVQTYRWNFTLNLCSGIWFYWVPFRSSWVGIEIDGISKRHKKMWIFYCNLV